MGEFLAGPQPVRTRAEQVADSRERQVREQADAIARKAAAIAGGRIPAGAERWAAVRLLGDMVHTLNQWIREEDPMR